MYSDLRLRPATGLLSILTMVAAGAAWAAASPFVGDWKLDPSRSTLTDVMEVTRVGAGKYTFDFGGGPETIVVDGTGQPGMSGTTLSVSAQGPDAWKVVREKDGRTMITANWKLSPDGRTLTDNFNQVSPDGSPSKMDYVYQRKGPGSGFEGTWVSRSVVVDFVYVVQIRPFGEDGLSITDSASQLSRHMKQDGKDYPNTGPSAAVIAASSIRSTGRNMLELTDKKSDGKPYDTQEIKLSADLKSLTMTIRTAGRDEPSILVFQRQQGEAKPAE